MSLISMKSSLSVTYFYKPIFHTLFTRLRGKIHSGFSFLSFSSVCLIKVVFFQVNTMTYLF